MRHALAIHAHEVGIYSLATKGTEKIEVAVAVVNTEISLTITDV